MSSSARCSKEWGSFRTFSTKRHKTKNLSLTAPLLRVALFPWKPRLTFLKKALNGTFSCEAFYADRLMWNEWTDGCLLQEPFEKYFAWSDFAVPFTFGIIFNCYVVFFVLKRIWSTDYYRHEIFIKNIYSVWQWVRIFLAHLSRRLICELLG